MARQSKQPRPCPKCGAPLKRTIGAQSRKKYWECTRAWYCYKVEASRVEA